MQRIGLASVKGVVTRGVDDSERQTTSPVSVCLALRKGPEQTKLLCQPNKYESVITLQVAILIVWRAGPAERTTTDSSFVAGASLCRDLAQVGLGVIDIDVERTCGSPCSAREDFSCSRALTVATGL